MASTTVLRTLIIAALAAIPVVQPAHSQAQASDALDSTGVLRAAANALGMLRWSDIGARTTRLPSIDVINTMEVVGTGTSYSAGQAFETEYHAAFSYNPPAMRVEITRIVVGNPERTIETVRESYAWNESETGGGLVPGKGTATPAMTTVKERLLRLWTLPYGVIKAALAAGAKTRISMENGAKVVTFPLSGQLAGVTVKASVDSKNFVTKVETRSDNPFLSQLSTETEYADYADHGEILTDVLSPGHIVQRQNGSLMLDIRVKMWKTSPYLVFPIPPNVKTAADPH